jgi:hypothetical protein
MVYFFNPWRQRILKKVGCLWIGGICLASVAKPRCGLVRHDKKT